MPNGKRGSGLTLIVGPNNAGKTTIIESLLLKENKKFKEADRHSNSSPIITIATDRGEYTFTNIDKGSQIKKEGSVMQEFEVIQARRHWHHYSNNSFGTEAFANHSREHETRNTTGIDTAGYLKEINKDQNKKNTLNNYMRKFIPHFTYWTIDTNDNGDYVKYHAANTEHQASMLGDGVISLFRICAHLVGAINDRVLIIDEPEISLHPFAQKSLSKVLSEVSANR